MLVNCRLMSSVSQAELSQKDVQVVQLGQWQAHLPTFETFLKQLEPTIIVWWIFMILYRVIHVGQYSAIMMTNYHKKYSLKNWCHQRQKLYRKKTKKEYKKKYNQSDICYTKSVAKRLSVWPNEYGHCLRVTRPDWKDDVV